jgi:hypothetical protein
VKSSHAANDNLIDRTQIAYAPQPTVWSADKERELVPVTGDGERPLPDARRPVSGRPEG